MEVENFPIYMPVPLTCNSEDETDKERSYCRTTFSYGMWHTPHDFCKIGNADEIENFASG